MKKKDKKRTENALKTHLINKEQEEKPSEKHKAKHTS